jgi:hypothetical protein
VLRCVAEQAEARLSFVGLADLVDGIADDHLPHLPGPQRRGLEVALVRRERSAQPPDPTAVGANGPRVRLSRNIGAVTTDFDGIEAMALRALGGSDQITVGDLAGTDLIPPGST